MKKVISAIFLLVVFVIFFPKSINAQGVVQCTGSCGTVIQCAGGYRVPDPCLFNPNVCCETMAAIDPSWGGCDPPPAPPNCWCNAPGNHTCVLETTVTPTPAPNCDALGYTGYTCISTVPGSCQAHIPPGIVVPACYIQPGVNGNCCEPPETFPNGCTNQGFMCKTVCAWNEINIFSFDSGCTTDPHYGNGYICCQTISPASCPGTCRDTCNSTEFEEDSINVCMDPNTHPPAGQKCCILKSNAKLSSFDIFCVGNNPNVRTTTPGRIATAIGCIPIDSLQPIAKFLLGWGIGIIGGIALILIVVAGFQIITSGGNPQKLNAGKELLTAAIMGVVLLLFGIYLLRLIGADILNIPEFGQ